MILFEANIRLVFQRTLASALKVCIWLALAINLAFIWLFSCYFVIVSLDNELAIKDNIDSEILKT